MLTRGGVHSKPRPGRATWPSSLPVPPSARDRRGRPRRGRLIPIRGGSRDRIRRERTKSGVSVSLPRIRSGDPDENSVPVRTPDETGAGTAPGGRASLTAATATSSALSSSRALARNPHSTRVSIGRSRSSCAASSGSSPVSRIHASAVSETPSPASTKRSGAQPRSRTQLRRTAPERKTSQPHDPTTRRMRPRMPRCLQRARPMSTRRPTR